MFEEKIDYILKKVFGFTKFRPGQEEIVKNLLAHRDVLAVMPTGSGKSLCFYVAAILFEGLTLVVSPLIALMQDQVNSLTKIGIKAAQINSRLTKGMCSKILKDALNLKYKILYVAPERLLTKSFLAVARNINIDMVVVDEAHCISKWGQDFRPSYVKMVEFFKLLQKRPIFACFTATATKNIKQDILNLLKLKNPYCFISGFNRENLFLDVLTVKEKDKIFKLVKLMKYLKDENVIIYCATRANVEKIYELLEEEGFCVTKYHAGLRLILRKRNQDLFLNGEKNILVATNAFGMGVDKKDIRYIIHFNMPMDLESYYQEVGRAGRDGKPSRCFMLFSKEDILINSFLIEKNKNEELSHSVQKENKLKSYDALREIEKYCQQKGCFKQYILKYFDEEAPECGNCGNCLRKGERFRFLKRFLKKFKIWEF